MSFTFWSVTLLTLASIVAAIMCFVVGYSLGVTKPEPKYKRKTNL